MTYSHTPTDPFRRDDIYAQLASILRFEDGTPVFNPRFALKIEQGKGFSVSKRFTGIVADGTVDIYFENPSNSDKTVRMVVIFVKTFAKAWVDIYRANSVTSAGTQMSPVNLNFGSSNSSVVVIYQGGTYNLGPNVHETVIPGGSHPRAIGDAAEVGETVVIPPGHNFVIRTTNKDSQAQDISVRFLWWEE